MYTCIRDLIVIVEFIDDDLDIEVSCTAMGVKLLL